MSDEVFDIVVLGGGPGGYVTAIRAAQLGKSVALVESTHLGGICLNWGCIPTKAMLKSAEVYNTFKRAEEFGLSAKGIGFNLNKIVNRSKKIALQLSRGVEHLLKKHSVNIFHGEAKLKSKNSVVVSVKGKNTILNASYIVIATGARAKELPVLKADGEEIWNYKHALRPSRIPKNLLVVGSGAIGVEFASFYNALGVKTTLIDISHRILPQEDSEIVEIAKKHFKKNGITIHENTFVKEVRKLQKLQSVTLNVQGKDEVHDFDTIISATGIVGNIENLGLEDIGIDTSNSHIVTDNCCRTNHKSIFAIGDVSGPPWLAHKASHEGVIVAEQIAGHDINPIKPKSIPACTFSTPQIASVGFSEKEAKENGFKIKIGKFPFIANGKALAIGEPEGLIKTICDSVTGEILGAHLIGAEVTELIHSFSLGRQLEGTDQDFVDTIFPHPTLSEMIHESALGISNRTIHF